MRENKRIDGRQRLVDATLDCLAEYGYQGSSVRRIASTAGVALNLVRHHFGNKAGLMSESYRHFRRSAMTAYMSEAKDAGTDPVKRLEAFAATLLVGQAAARRRIMKIWISYLPLLVADRNIAAVHAETYEFFLQELADCLTRIYAQRGETPSPDDIRRLAIAIYSAIDGIWLECALNPSRMTPDEALKIALDLIGPRIGISFGNCADNMT
ncbi:MAG: TetR/AcrR family transcriptional regulator [Chromatiales bacterium]|nr:TetR/AcrR family transcriptional regulator [Chromatiales bacterium]